MRLLLLLLPLLFLGCSEPLKGCYTDCWEEWLWCTDYCRNNPTTSYKSCRNHCKAVKRMCSKDCRALYLGKQAAEYPKESK